MGFGPSAGWAQALTEVVTAELPKDKRLHPSQPVPVGLPVWGSICDDIWAMEEHLSDRQDGPAWLNRAAELWEEKGVPMNDKKSVDQETDQEVQGYLVNSRKHWVGVAWVKRRQLFVATLTVLRMSRVPTKVLEIC